MAMKEIQLHTDDEPAVGSLWHWPSALIASAGAGEFSVYHVGNSLTGDLTSKLPKLLAQYRAGAGPHLRLGNALPGRHQLDVYS